MWPILSTPLICQSRDDITMIFQCVPYSWFAPSLCSILICALGTIFHGTWKLWTNRCCENNMFCTSCACREKREEIWCSRMTNTPKRQTMHINTFDYTAITDRLRTVSWSDNSHSIGVVWLTWGLKAQPSHFLQWPCNQNDIHLKM